MATGGAMVRESTYPMVEVDAAVATVLSFASDDLGEEMVGLDAVEGRVLHGDVVATQDVPPFRASVKDGYAVQYSEGAGTFEVSGEVTAGKPPGVPVGQGKVAYVTTGAPVPDEADAVVQVEWTRAVEGRDGLVEITTPAPKVGHDIRKVGADIARGQTILHAREVVHMAEIGLLATCNVGQVPVFRRPVVGILSTGDELLDCGSEMTPGTIIDSNRPMLLAAVRAVGGDAADLGIARDEREHVEASFRRAIETTDVLVTSGGVSMGNRDFVKPLLEEYGKVSFLNHPSGRDPSHGIPRSRSRSILVACS